MPNFFFLSSFTILRITNEKKNKPLKKRLKKLEDLTKKKKKLYKNCEQLHFSNQSIVILFVDSF